MKNFLERHLEDPVRFARIEFHAHEEGIGLAVVELLRFEDIPPALEQEGRDARGDAGAIGAGQGED